METNLSQLMHGDIDGFKKVYHEYHAKLYFYVLKHTQSAYLAEETVQMAFIKLWEKRERLSKDIELSIQLFRIAKSIMIDLLRKEGKRHEHTLLFGREQNELEEDFDLIRKDDLQHVYTIVERMSPVRRIVFKLSRFHGMPHKEIARHLSIAPKTVENHIGRAIKELKQAVASFFIL